MAGPSGRCSCLRAFKNSISVRVFLLDVSFFLMNLYNLVVSLEVTTAVHLLVSKNKPHLNGEGFLRQHEQQSFSGIEVVGSVDSLRRSKELHQDFLRVNLLSDFKVRYTNTPENGPTEADAFVVNL